MVLPKYTTALIQPSDQGNAHSCHYLQTASATVQFETTRNYWSKCILATGDGAEHKEQLLGFTEENAGKASNTLHNRLQVNNLQAYVHEDDETPVAVYKDDEETVAEVINHGRIECLSEDDSENEEICEL